MPAHRQSVVNFAYGSNMLRARIAERVPSARAIGPAVLPGYVLRWHKSGQGPSGKCDVVAHSAPGAAVHGVLYEIPISQKGGLDRAEGVGFGYEERSLQVLRRGEAVSACIYVATKVDSALRPYTWYKALVMAGARQHNLPVAYIEALEATQAVEDPDRDRHALNMALSRNDA